MGRPEKPIDPDSGPLARFAADLRALRGEAGITYRGMSRRAHYSVTSLAAAAAGDELPTLAVTLAYAEACGGDTAEWERRWRALAARQGDTPPLPAPELPAASRPQVQPQPRRRSRPRRPAVIGAVGTLVVLAAVAVIVLGMRSTGAAKTTPPHTTVTHAGSSSGSAGSVSPVLTAGLGCPLTPARNFSDYDAPGSDGWHRISGGWSGDGCSGLAEYTHITGLPDTWAETADWVFQTPAARHCSLAVYIPDDAEADGTATYDLYNSTDTTYDSRLTTITIDQATHHGEWVAAGTYTFAHPVVDLEITDRGAGHATITLSAARLTCT